MMHRLLTALLILLSTPDSFPQTSRFDELLADSVMKNASVSFFVADADSNNVLFAHNPAASLIPASALKLITSAAALELLGPGYTFRTFIGYTGSINKRSGRLDGNIIIKGGGDPALGSGYFTDHYKDFISDWVEEIKKAGIRKIRGKILTDDSYFDYEPAAPRWLWEDLGAYYGAGVFGLSVFDNRYKIAVKPSPDSSRVEIISVTPGLKNYSFTNRLTASGTKENWYVYATPYSNSGWLSGTIPAVNVEYIIDAAIPDPPLLIAGMLHEKLESEGIEISGDPSTVRLEPGNSSDNIIIITETVSPFLSLIIDVLNKESVNLYAEHLVKELGKHYKNIGTTAAGIGVIRDFIAGTGVDTAGLFIEDGSGLSSRNGISSEALTRFLLYMKMKARYFPEFFSSLSEAGKNGTLSQYFSDPLFESNLKAKSGSMTRVRCYAGYFTANSGRHIVFSILINNFQGEPGHIVSHIEEILKELIMNK